LVDGGVFVEPGFGGEKGQDDNEAHDHNDDVLLYLLLEDLSQFEILFSANDLVLRLLLPFLFTLAHLHPSTFHLLLLASRHVFALKGL
jgi:hypothetical protein